MPDVPGGRKALAVMLLSVAGGVPAVAESWCRLGAVDLLVGGARPACNPVAAASPPRRPLAAVDPADSAVRVPTRLQAQRDADRRAILQGELQSLRLREHALLAEAGADAGQAALRRTQDDIRAVQAELARLAGA